MLGPSTTTRLLVLVLLPLSLAAPAALAADEDDPRLAQAEEYLEVGRAREALALVDKVLARRQPSGRALLARGTARIMLGDDDEGIADLRRAVELDPALRQGWLNLAAVEIAEERYEAAYDALRKAQELEPGAPDNHLNLGAVLVLDGKLEEASEHFERYLELNPDSAEASYLVAANYALAGYEALAVENLKRAIELDERMRLRARSDDKFVLLDGARYRELLVTDSYRPPPGAYRAEESFAEPYERGEGKLLSAVIDALGEVGEPFEVRIEATDRWALLWGDFRVKVTNRADGRGVVRLSAPADRFTPGDWKRRTEALFAAIHRRLQPAETRLPRASGRAPG